VIKQEYNYGVINTYGGKIKIRKTIENDLNSTYLHLKDNYDFELISLKIKRIFIDDIKMDVEDFKDIQMFGTLLNLCEYDLHVGTYEFVDACTVEYHVKMFNKFRDNKWTNERFMKESDMKSIGEGRSLNQLIPLYIK
jgi:hypothetical protein